MSAAVGSASTNQAARLLLGMNPPPSDHHHHPDERESATTTAGRIRTLLDLLMTEKIGGLDRTTRSNGAGGASRWRALRERLGFGTSVIGCCGASTWRFGSSPLVDDEDTSDDEDGVVLVEFGHQQQEVDQQARDSAARGMNLAAALAAEREVRPPRTPLRRLLTAEKSGLELEREREGEVEVGGESDDSVCCVCMGRKKGAAMIPCGHTYCRVCSREVRITRGCCPLCNRPILDILDLF
uniref:RING-type domain-containing protein n=1 Tax=Opuntia streptacantha TaxID=393608 RepID=A0A7C8YGW9_OPUST